MLKKWKIKIRKAKRSKKKKSKKQARKISKKKAKHTKVYFAFFNPNDTASYARVYQHDVRAKQTKVCDAERAGFQTPPHASIEAKRNLVTRRQRRVINYFKPADCSWAGCLQRPSPDGKPGSGFPARL